MRILMISGAYPPQLCGIGDYTEQLVESLKQQGADVEVLANINWSVSNFFKIIEIIDAIKPDVIHIQYPSAGYRFSIVPQLLSLWYKTYVTLHEFTQSHVVRKLMLIPFSFRSRLVFTNGFESKAFKRIFSWTKIAGMIPIGSNITSIVGKENSQREQSGIVYFGQIRPGKGIEDVIALAGQIKNNHLPYKVIIAGQLFDIARDYFTELKTRADGLPVSWHVNLSKKEISELLSSHTFAYLPFPDGASERRGSLYAVFVNKLIVFSTSGKQTSPELADTFVNVQTVDSMVDILKDTQPRQLVQNFQLTQANAALFMTKIAWPKIAQMHIALYGSKT